MWPHSEFLAETKTTLLSEDKWGNGQIPEGGMGTSALQTDKQMVLRTSDKKALCFYIYTATLESSGEKQVPKKTNVLINHVNTSTQMPILLHTKSGTAWYLSFRKGFFSACVCVCVI